MARDQAVVVYQPNPSGGRLAYYADEANAEFWDALWERSAPDYSRYERGYLPRHLHHTFLAHVPRGSRVLEAGCGQAVFTVAAAALGYRAEGVDYATRVVDRVKEQFPDLTLFVGDVRDLSTVPDGTYDAVYSPGVCEHFVEGPDAVLVETARILRPGGIAIVSAPSFNPARHLLVRGRLIRRHPIDAPFYQYAFSASDLTERMGRVSLDVIAVERYSGIVTLEDHIPGMRRLPRSMRYRLAQALEVLPPVRHALGHVGIWVARKLDA